jgi:hypothetical protein
MLLNLPDEGGDGISPSFTHTSSFSKAETTTVGGTTGKSGRETVTVRQLGMTGQSMELTCTRE